MSLFTGLLGGFRSSFTGPGDIVAGALGSWGLDAYSLATAGTSDADIINTVPATQTFNSLSNGKPNVAGITTFLAGGAGKIPQLYDKAGANPALQTTDANRPTITLGGIGGKTWPTFDGLGATQSLNCGNSNTLNPISALTISAWFTTTENSHESFIVGRDDNALGRSYALGKDGNGLKFQVLGSQPIGTTTIPSINTPYHIAVSGSAASNVWTLYLNGVSIGTGAWVAPPATTGPTTIGQRSYSGFEGFWNGCIDDVQIWGNELTPTQIAAIYAAGLSFFFNMTPPPQALAVGYGNRAFYDDFDSTGTIDMANSQAGNFNWYLSQWFNHGTVALAAGDLSVSNSVLTIASTTGRALVTAFDTNPATPDQFHGNVFGGGGYIEARMKFNPAQGGGVNFFAMAIEHIADNGSVSLGHWPGQAATYAHFIEVDFFETLGTSTTQYQSTTHDWGGIFNGTTYPQNIVDAASNVISIGAADFTQFHTYGCLWVSQSGSTPGRLQRYFDNVLVQTIYYLGPPGSPPLPTDGTNTYSPSLIGQADRTYSILDTQRLAFSLFGSSTAPLQVDWVKVWK